MSNSVLDDPVDLGLCFPRKVSLEKKMNTTYLSFQRKKNKYTLYNLKLISKVN